MIRRAWLIVLLAGGCYAPKINNGDFKCPMPEQLCPTGFSCVQGACYRTSMLGSLDLGPGIFAGDGSGGALDLSGMSGSLGFNTDTGEVRFTPEGGTSTSIVAPGGGGFQKLTQPSGGPTIGLWQFTDVTIPSTVTALPFGTSQSVFGLAATDTITIDGAIDWRGFGGPAGIAGANGSGRASGVTSGGAGATDSAGSGGGGGGAAVEGLNGMGAAPGMGGARYGTADLTPVHVGSGGGGGSGTTSGAKGGGGGLGGGAIALFANKIVIAANIDVSGNAGRDADASATAPSGGGGGGSGGSILVSGVTVTFDTGHQLTASGGSGGHGVSGSAGGAGSDGRIWVGARQLNITGGSLMAMPTETRSDTPITTFPR